MRAALALLLLLPAPLPAQEVDCATATSTPEISFCAAQRLEEADARLNGAYGEAIAAARRGGHEELLREAQRAWIAYRDAACSAEATAFEGGTMQPVAGTVCKARLTDQRAADLLTYARTIP